MPPPGARSWPPANASASPPPKRWPPQACTEMRAIALQRFAPDGDTTALVMTERPQPAPHAAGEVPVRVKACSLNFRDWLMLAGQYNPNQQMTLATVSDGAGEVVAWGDRTGDVEAKRVQVRGKVGGGRNIIKKERKYKI